MLSRAVLIAAVITLIVNSSPAFASESRRSSWIGAVEAYAAPADARALGIGWERVNFWWNEIQPESPADWNLAIYAARDAQLQRDHADGIAIVGLIGNPPAWATTNGSVPKHLDLPIDHPENYWARFVERLVTQYAGLIDDWIIWNEPDFDPGQPANTWAGTTGDYYRLLRTAYQVAKRANPRARIVFAGTTYWADVNQGRKLFLERVLLDAQRQDPAGAAHGYYFDAVSIHIYSTAKQLYTIPLAYREVLNRFGLEKPIWISEMNVVPYNDPVAPLPPGGYRATLDEQAAFMIQGLALARAAGVERVAVYKLIDGQLVGGEPYGLVRNDGSHRPAFAAVQTAIQYLGDVGPGSYQTTDGVDSVTFQTGDRRITVLWNATNQPRQSRIQAVGRQARLIDPAGRVEPLQVPIVAGESVYRLPLPPATAELTDLSPGQYIIGGKPLILVEEGVGQGIELDRDHVFYPITGHFVAYGFLDYFRRYGGIATFGYPRTEEIVEDGRTVQYFQRARMEWVPGPKGGRVQLALLNDLLWQDRPPQQRPILAPDARIFPETGYAVAGAFRRFFEARGGLEIFGYPISNEIVEPDGHRVQQFQRMRLEYHPENAGTPDEIQLGLVGDEYLQRTGRLPTRAGE